MTGYPGFLRILVIWTLFGLALIGTPSSGMVGTGEAAESAVPAADDDFEYDPWEPFNEKVFEFNRRADRYVLKPVATGYDRILPDLVQKGVRNAFENLGVVRRVVNNLFQLKLDGAGREFFRFAINSIYGVGGLIDVASADGLNLQPSDEDMGQTLGVYGVGPGPYLILPLMPPLTVRDGIGSAVDGAMNPLNYVLPMVSTVSMRVLNTVNERSLNLDRFEQVEESVVDLYGAVRNGYLQRRAAAIKE